MIVTFAVLYVLRSQIKTEAGPDLLILAVVFFPIRYGLGAGVISAITASLIFTEPALLNIIRNEQVIFPAGTFYSLALFWAFGLFVGLDVEQTRQRMQYFRDVNSQWKDQLHKVQTNYTSLQKVTDACRSRILMMKETLPEFWQLTKSSASGDPHDVLTAATELIRKSAKVELGAIYLYEGEKLIRKSMIGKPELMPEQLRAEDLQQPVVKTALKTGKLADIKTLGLSLSSEQERYLACAVIPGPRKIRGIVLIRWMDFVDFTDDNLKHLEVGSELIANWLEKAYGEDLGTSLPNERMEAFQFRPFLQYVLWEVYRTLRTGKPMSVIVFRFNSKCAQTDFLMKTIAAVVIANLRRVDLIARHDEPGVILAMLPDTDVEGGKIAANNIVESLEKYAFSSEKVGLSYSFNVTKMPTYASNTKQLEHLLHQVTKGKALANDV